MFKPILFCEKFKFQSWFDIALGKKQQKQVLWLKFIRARILLEGRTRDKLWSNRLHEKDGLFSSMSSACAMNRNLRKALESTYSFPYCYSDTYLWSYNAFMHGRRKDFFQGWAKEIFPGVTKRNFSRGEGVVKFHFTNSKTREQPFCTENLIEKYQI